MSDDWREPMRGLAKSQGCAALNLGDGTWTIPGARTKNHRPHAVPLPPVALDILAAVPRIEGDLVFTTTGTSPISGWSKIKRALDAVMGLKVSPWRLHDLRRTAASGMSRLGVRSEVVDRALNHITGSFRGVAGTYQRDPLSAREDWPPLSRPKM